MQAGTSKDNRKPARILALDYGRARIGMAIADAQARLARPLGTLERINRNEDMRRLRELVREQGVKQVIVGLPLRLDGTRGEMAEEASRFAERMRKQIGVPVEMADERLTSWEAERILEEELGRKISHPSTPLRAGRGTPTESGQAPRAKARKKKEDGTVSVDAVAAMVMLREYLQQASAAERQELS
jgi:putative Holliday junction resolvase